jgi:hypothetical protein
MTAQPPASGRRHLWVSYPYMPGEAEICTLCGEFQTPENAAGDCAETNFMTEIEPLPHIPSLAWPEGLEHIDLATEGADDEMREGAIIPP